MSQLRPRDERLAVALATGQPVKVAARSAGIAYSTAKVRMARPEVSARIAELVAEYTARTVALAAFATLTSDQQSVLAHLLHWPGRAARLTESGE